MCLCVRPEQRTLVDAQHRCPRRKVALGGWGRSQVSCVKMDWKPLTSVRPTFLELKEKRGLSVVHFPTTIVKTPENLLRLGVCPRISHKLFPSKGHHACDCSLVDGSQMSVLNMSGNTASSKRSDMRVEFTEALVGKSGESTSQSRYRKEEGLAWATLLTVSTQIER